MDQRQYDPIVNPVTESNSLGIGGFVCALIGLVLGPLTGGLGAFLCLIGLVLSLIALGRRPRSFAIAGVILGLLGSCAGIAIVLVAGMGLLAMFGLVAFALLMESDRIQLTLDMVNITAVVQRYEEENRRLPESLDGLEVSESMLLDPWGMEYRYQLIPEFEMGFDLVSAGPDHQFDTDDDIRLSRLDEAWEGAFQGFREKLEEHRDHPIDLHFEGEDDAEAEPAAEVEAEDPAGGVGSPEAAEGAGGGA